MAGGPSDSECARFAVDVGVGAVVFPKGLVFMRATGAVALDCGGFRVPDVEGLVCAEVGVGTVASPLVAVFTGGTSSGLGLGLGGMQ